VILLGALVGLVRGSYWTAVALNVAAYVASAFFVRGLATAVGRSPLAAWAAGASYLVLPAFLPYVFWAMAEVVLGALFLAALWTAAVRGESRKGAVLAGLLFALAFLVRESALFGLPALLALLLRRGRVKAFLVTVLAFLLLVYAPLSRGRAPGGANFWAPTSGKVFGFETVQAASGGRFAAAAGMVAARASRNLGELLSPATAPVEKGILACYAFLAVGAFAGGRRSGPLGRRLLAGLGLGLVSMLCVLLGVYVIAQWSGFRYLMFLMPPLLPAFVSPLETAAPLMRRAALPALLVVSSLVLCAGTLTLLNAYKASRQKRQEGRSLTRIALPNGWLFGLKHYPVEVISSVPEQGGELRLLEKAVWFEVLVMPADTPLAAELEGRPKYRRLNASDPEPPLLIYRRLR
jgi:hypothetical protein